jgi:hypothetical protein
MSESFEHCHYVAFDKYFIYEVSNFEIDINEFANDPNLYEYELGAVYSYDIGRIVFDPNIGTQQVLSATSLNTGTDYALVREAFRSYIEQQNSNGLAVDTVTTSYISMAAINEWMLYGQDESFLGLSPEEIELFESQLGEHEYYYIDAEGNLHADSFPVPTPEAPSFWQRFALWATAISTIAVGVVVSVAVTVVTCGAAVTAMSIVTGAMLGAGIEMLMQAIDGKGINQVNWLKVGVAAVSGALAAIPGIGWIGAGLVAGGTQAAMTAIDGGSWEDIAKSFVIGFATGALIHGATKLLGKASSKIADKLGKCFVAGTAVLAVVGGVAVLKNIEDIRVGDYVYTYNVTTGQNEVQQVTDTLTSIHSELIKVSTSDGQTISSSLTHPYYTQRGWIEAQDLRAGDILRTVNGKKVIVEFIQHEILEKSQILYNFEVVGNNNYYVAQNASVDNNQFILVHNFCKDVGTYHLKFESGKEYIGKGPISKMNASIKRIQKEYGDDLVEGIWKPAFNDNSLAFMNEARWMNEAASKGTQLYNKILSPGHSLIDFGDEMIEIVRKVLLK